MKGGQPELRTHPVRIPIVDNDITSSASLEVMLLASGCPEFGLPTQALAAS